MWHRRRSGRPLQPDVQCEVSVMSAHPVERSFELAAERCEDLAPLVYQRLFREHPETEAMFRSEGSGLVKGSMLALTIDALLDFAGDRSGHFRMIECEVSSHDAYGTPRELFVAFFGVIAGTLRDILAPTGRPRSMARGGTCLVRSRASWRFRLKTPAPGNSIRYPPSS